MRARTHTHTHPKHMPTLWACVWAFTDLKKTYPGLRTKNSKYQKFLVLLPHFSMEYNIAHKVWKVYNNNDKLNHIEGKVRVKKTGGGGGGIK